MDRWRGYPRFLLAASLLIAPLLPLGRARPALGQDDQATVREAQEEERGNTLIPLPIVFYQPETGLGFGVTGMYFLQPPPPRLDGPQGTRVQSSYLSAVVIFTLKKQTIVSVGAELYPDGGNYRFLGEASFSKFPTKFWGIGNEQPDSLEEDYTPLTFSATAELQRRVALGWYAGGVAHFGHRELRDTEDDGLLSSGFVAGIADGHVVGLGLLLTRDTRSSTIYPRTGGHHQLRALAYGSYLGSDYDFGLISLDLRRYWPLLETHVLALRALGIVSPGIPPFDLLPQLGGESLLRGYFAGRYRDRDLLAVQAEYRAPVWWRFGVVAFGEAGQVQHDLNDFRSSGFHPTLGFGVRIQLSSQEELNIRADYGWGFDVKSGGFYLSFGEAF